MLSSSRLTLVTTANLSPSRATASATRRGSSKSIGSGRPLGTAQKPQRRVQRFPSSMKVAVRWFQHSPMLGHCADSQTVCRSRDRAPVSSAHGTARPSEPWRAASCGLGAGAAETGWIWIKSEFAIGVSSLRCRDEDCGLQIPAFQRVDCASPDWPPSSKSFQIGEQSVNLGARESIAKGRHLGTAAHDHFRDAIVVGRHAAWQVLFFVYVVKAGTVQVRGWNRARGSGRNWHQTDGGPWLGWELSPSSASDFLRSTWQPREASSASRQIRADTEFGI